MDSVFDLPDGPPSIWLSYPQRFTWSLPLRPLEREATFSHRLVRLVFLGSAFFVGGGAAVQAAQSDILRLKKETAPQPYGKDFLFPNAVGREADWGGRLPMCQQEGRV